MGPDRARMRESLPSQTTSWKYVEQTFCRCVPVCACATLDSPLPHRRTLRHSTKSTCAAGGGGLVVNWVAGLVYLGCFR